MATVMAMVMDMGMAMDTVMAIIKRIKKHFLSKICFGRSVQKKMTLDGIR